MIRRNQSNIGKYLTVFLVIGFVLTVLSLVVYPFDVIGEYSSGERVGTIVKFSRKGIVCKTFEGELRVGSMASAVPEKWLFSTKDAEVAEKIEMFLSSGAPVRLVYTQPMVSGRCDGESSYRIIDVIGMGE